MATRFGLDCQVLGPQEIQDLKMGALWAVAQGSQQEPARLIVIRYSPDGCAGTARDRIDREGNYL